MPPQVDFYLPALKQQNAQHLVACRLAAKAYHQGLNSYILVNEERQARQLDQLLWCYDDCSFIPHELLPPPDVAIPASPIRIGNVDVAQTGFEVLISLQAEIPANYIQYQRIIDVIANAEGEKVKARKRYRFYLDQGFSPNYHNLDS